MNLWTLAVQQPGYIAQDYSNFLRVEERRALLLSHVLTQHSMEQDREPRLDQAFPATQGLPAGKANNEMFSTLHQCYCVNTCTEWNYSPCKGS